MHLVKKAKYAHMDTLDMLASSLINSTSWTDPLEARYVAEVL